VKGESRGAVSASAITKSFGASIVLRDCSLGVPANSFTALVGPSGCGKTTLINMIAGYETPDQGSITVDGVAVHGPGWDRLVVFQETALFPWKTTMANVMFGPINRGVSRRQAALQAKELLARFGLAGFEQKYPSQLSGGMQRRAELARAMINSPNVMLLDEPFRGLDALTRELMQEYLLRVFEENRITTLFVTTEIEEAIYLADRIVVLSGRPATAKETIDVLLPRPRHIRMLASPEFGRIHRRLLASLIEEAEKSFTSSTEAAADILKGAAEAWRKRVGVEPTRDL
jgi:NitT/TauT family transport system ATP-binding protein